MARKHWSKPGFVTLSHFENHLDAGRKIRPTRTDPSPFCIYPQNPCAPVLRSFLSQAKEDPWSQNHPQNDPGISKRPSVPSPVNIEQNSLFKASHCAPWDASKSQKSAQTLTSDALRLETSLPPGEQTSYRDP